MPADPNAYFTVFEERMHAFQHQGGTSYWIMPRDGLVLGQPVYFRLAQVLQALIDKGYHLSRDHVKGHDCIRVRFRDLADLEQDALDSIIGAVRTFAPEPPRRRRTTATTEVSHRRMWFSYGLLIVALVTMGIGIWQLLRDGFESPANNVVAGLGAIFWCYAFVRLVSVVLIVHHRRINAISDFGAKRGLLRALK